MLIMLSRAKTLTGCKPQSLDGEMGHYKSQCCWADDLPGAEPPQWGAAPYEVLAQWTCPTANVT